MIALRRPRSSKGTQAASRQASAAPSYEGCLQGVGNGHALGWCWEPARPENAVQVAIVVDGEIVAEGAADIARPDLAAYGNGAYGFMLALPDMLQAPGRHRVLALAGPERAPIKTAPSFWHEAGSDNGWSDVVFEAGGALSARVPDPPASDERRALVAGNWLCDADEMLARGPLDEQRLDRIVSALTEIGEACAALGVSYLPALIPCKRDVLAGAPPGERTWVAQLDARLRDIDHVELLDLLPVLRDSATYGAAYHRTDADWNDRGAFFVTRAVLKEAHKRAPALRPPALTDLRLCQVPAYRGALADAQKVRMAAGKLVACEVDVETEHGIAIDASAQHALRMPVEHHLAALGSTHLRVYATPGRDDQARLALVGDSAALSLVPWLAEHTSRTTFYWTGDLPLEQLELELPPVVVHLVREAELHSGALPGLICRYYHDETDSKTPSAHDHGDAST